MNHEVSLNYLTYRDFRLVQGIIIKKTFFYHCRSHQGRSFLWCIMQELMITGENVNLDQCKVKLSCSLERWNEASCHSRSERSGRLTVRLCGRLRSGYNALQMALHGAACSDSALRSFFFFAGFVIHFGCEASWWLFNMCLRSRCLCKLTCWVSFVINAIIIILIIVATRSCYSLIQYVMPSARQTFGRCGRNDNELVGDFLF